MSTKTDERKIELHYKSNDLEFKSHIKIKVQGSSSLHYTKKNYTIKLYEDNTYNEKKDVELKNNWGKQHKYYLKANWIDKTHSRNIVTSNLIAQTQKKYNLFMDSPNNGQIDGFPVEVYINKEFLGLYTWNIPKDNWMLNMDNSNENHIAIISNNHSLTNKFKDTTTLTNNDWEIECGPETEETITKFNRLINFIKNSSDEEFKTNFNEYLNLDAMLNYYVFTEVATLTDSIDKNMLLTTYDGEIWYPTLYDLDTSWGTTWKGTETIEYNASMEPNYNDSILFQKFQKNFSKEIANRYFDLRKNILTKENIIKEFNTFNNSIPKSTLEKENTKWGPNIPGYNLNQIEKFLEARLPILDNKIYAYYKETPQIDIKHETLKPTIKPVKVTLKTNRNDIIFIKDGKKSYNYTYTFKKNGTYTLEYQDWYGNNLGTITIEINNIKTNLVISTCLAILIIIIGIILVIKSRKNTTKKDNKPKEEKNNQKQSKKKSPKK